MRPKLKILFLSTLAVVLFVSVARHMGAVMDALRNTVPAETAQTPVLQAQLSSDVKEIPLNELFVSWRKTQPLPSENPHGDDINVDGASDLLLFSSIIEPAVWRAVTLDGFDAPKRGAMKEHRWERGFRAGSLHSIPVPGDYNGDGKTDLVVYKPGFMDDFVDPTGNWELFFADSETDRGVISLRGGKKQLVFGSGKDMPVPGDFDGDGKFDLALYGSGQWKILFSKHDFSYAESSLYPDEYSVQVAWGGLDDTPIAADFDGDGRYDLGLHGPTEHERIRWRVYYLPAADGSKRKSRELFFGAKGDQPLAGDFNCDGIADIAVFRPSTRKFLVRVSMEKTVTLDWSVQGEEPFVGDFDGDGCADFAFYNRKPPHKWFIYPSQVTDEQADTMPAMKGLAFSYDFGDSRLLPPALARRDFYRQLLLGS